MRLAGWVLARLPGGESARGAGTGPHVRAIEQPEDSVTHRFHHPEQAQAQCYAKPVNYLNRKLDGLEPLDLGRFGNLQVLPHGGL
jgi:hypothetical protein